MLKIIAIGDVHFKYSNIPEVDLFIPKILELLTQIQPDFIVLMGDILDTHERIHTIPLNKAYEFIDSIRNISKVYILVGNHDMCSNKEFLTDNHWMNGLKKWQNIVIVDRVVQEVINNFKIIFCPYVSNGRFEEALNTLNNEWRDTSIIFAHQEFRGCKMGAINSIDGDIWDITYPEIISGHIHSKQTPQSNIYYTGSAIQHAFAEGEKNTIPFITLNNVQDKYNLEEIDLHLPRKYIIYMNVDDLYDYNYVKTNDKIRITVSGLFEQFKALKKTQKYKELVSNGVKINFNQKKIETGIDTLKKDINNFNEILLELVNLQNDPYISEVYYSIIK